MWDRFVPSPAANPPRNRAPYQVTSPWLCLSPSLLYKSVHNVVLQSQFPHKSVNLPFIITNMKNKLTNLCGNWLLQNDLMNTSVKWKWTETEPRARNLIGGAVARGVGGGRRHQSISQKVLTKSFFQSQFPHKSVDWFCILLKIK